MSSPPMSPPPIEVLKALLIAQYELAQLFEVVIDEDHKQQVLAGMDAIHFRIGELYAAIRRS